MTAIQARSRLRLGLRQMFSSRPVLVGFIILTLLLFAAVFAPWLTPYGPNDMAIPNRLKPPSWNHPFGTDEFGRDVLTRAIYAGRISLLVGAGVVTLALVVGVILGLVAGYFSRIDGPISRLLDAMMAFPDILLAIALVASLGASLSNVIIALGVTFAPRVARIVRGSTMVLTKMPYVEAALVMGLGTRRVLGRHILINLTSPIFVQATFIFALAMLSEASLSFLGIGMSPDVPTWGTMLAAGRSHISQAPWLMYAPGFSIVLAVFSLQMLGDGLRDLVDPRLTKEV